MDEKTIKNIESKIINKIRLSKAEIDIFISDKFEPFTDYTLDVFNHMSKKMKDMYLKDEREQLFERDLSSSIINYIGTADKKSNFSSQYGWISTDGNYYSCEHGMHETKAQMVIRSNKPLLINYIESFDSDQEAFKSLITMSGENNPGDFLLSKGWCKLQNVDLGEPKVVLHPLKELTEKQIDTIYELAFHYKLKKDPITKKEFDWSK